MGKRRRLVFVCILLPLCVSSQVKADYYDYHVDEGDYCMQAKDVRITEAQRKAWSDEGRLKEQILEKSGLFVNEFHPSDSARYWTAYEGSYEADIEALENLKIPEGQQSMTVPVTFCIDGQDDISVTINVQVTASEQRTEAQENKKTEEATQKQEAPSDDRTEQSETGQKILTEPENTHSGSKEKRNTQRVWKLSLFWLIMTMIALLGFGGGLYSDYKVLRKYNRKRKEYKEGNG